jgi:hypothetical protein
MNYNPLSPAVQDNPYPYYVELRNKAPIAWIESMQAWAVSRYADVDFALRNPQIFSSASWVATMQGDVNDTKFPWIIGLDPPDHTRLRKLANKGFTPRLVRSLAPRVQTITQDLMTAVKNHPECDLVAALSAPGGFSPLLTVSGIGQILGMTIRLETGEIGRFTTVGDFASSCRCVGSQQLSNGKRKGQGHVKNGNKYLAWAFVEAAHFAVRYDAQIKRFSQRKQAKTNTLVASKAVAHKLARAGYYSLREQGAFMVDQALA